MCFYAYKNVLEPMGHLGANLIFSILTLNQDSSGGPRARGGPSRLQGLDFYYYFDQRLHRECTEIGVTVRDVAASRVCATPQLRAARRPSRRGASPHASPRAEAGQNLL